MTSRERVLAALAHSQPDFTPCDYYATPEIHEVPAPRRLPTHKTFSAYHCDRTTSLNIAPRS